MLAGVSEAGPGAWSRVTEVPRGRSAVWGDMARLLILAGLWLVSHAQARATAYELVYLTGVPDYEWHAGCFGTATGNLMGYWDRHGFPEFYVGPTAGGVAPLNSFGANSGILSLWASEAGRDGRPANRPGHWNDY